mmetsp:Transcript_38768/g.91824  ORF Transcript_38768/g.91824 Transcript_38768/m.91824 type:complete len:208 (-) Transcript_38768:357-980(-)
MACKRLPHRTERRLRLDHARVVLEAIYGCEPEVGDHPSARRERASDPAPCVGLQELVMKARIGKNVDDDGCESSADSDVLFEDIARVDCQAPAFLEGPEPEEAPRGGDHLGVQLPPVELPFRGKRADEVDDRPRAQPNDGDRALRHERLDGGELVPISRGERAPLAVDAMNVTAVVKEKHPPARDLRRNPDLWHLDNPNVSIIGRAG